MSRAQAFVVMLVAVLLGGCRRPPERPLVLTCSTAPITFKPNEAMDECSQAVLVNVYESLVYVDSDLGLHPGLAESWYTLDDFTWVFRLAPGIPLHDGRTLVARDVVAALEHARSGAHSRRRVALEALASIDAPDDRTLVIRTSRAFDTLASRVGRIFIWAAGQDGRPVGTGPYRLRDASPGMVVHLEAFEGYRRGPARIRDVEFRVVRDPDERVRELLAGRIHVAPDISPEALARLRGQSTVRATTLAGVRVVLLTMDTARAHTPYVAAARNPFRDVRVRRAVAMAIDRESLVHDVLSGLAETVNEIATPLEWRGGPTLSPGRHDPLEARRLLTEAGFPDGFRVTLDVADKLQAMEHIVEVLVRDLGRVGIHIEPRIIPLSELLHRIETRDISFYLAWVANEAADPTLTYDYLLHTPRGLLGTLNGGGYSNPRLDALLSEASGRLTARQRRERLAEAARIVIDDLPLVPLYRQLDLYGVAADLHFTPRVDRRLEVATMYWTR